MAEASLSQVNVAAADPEAGHDSSSRANRRMSGPLRMHNCCLKTRHFLESSAFSFTLGVLLFVLGICLIAASPNIKQDNFFLIGPFCLAAGTILVIRGCINELAKRQQAREQAHAENHSRQPLTTSERRDRNEQTALSEENMVIPPTYEEAVKPKPAPQMAEASSQVNFPEYARSADRPPRVSTRFSCLTSISSQTEFPDMVDIAVDTSDLPQELDAVSQAPPSYNQALSPLSSVVVTADPDPAPSEVSVYLPAED